MDVSLKGAQDLAKEAYVFFFPMVEHYKLIYSSAAAPSYFNQWTHITKLSDHTDRTGVLLNNDTLYSMLWLDLRTEPMVISLPPIARDRFYSMQICDLFHNNVTFLGSKIDGNNGGHFLITGPTWQGTVPSTIKRCVVGESEFLGVCGRTELKGADDLEQVRLIQEKYTLTSLAEFNGGTALPQKALPNFPPFQDDQMERGGFFSYVNFCMGFTKIHPSEDQLYARYTRIGIFPGAPFPLLGMDTTIYEAIEQGIWAGSRALNDEIARPKGKRKDGWEYSLVYGPREFWDSRYLARAAIARQALYGNDAEQAVYISAKDDAQWDKLDGRKHARYELKLAAEQIPKVNAFWSITMYDEFGYLIENSLGRYSIGDRTEGLQFDSDGSLTIYIQYDNPSVEKVSNWLPCPDAYFMLFMRVYWPKDEILYGDYFPPGIQKKVPV